MPVCPTTRIRGSSCRDQERDRRLYVMANTGAGVYRCGGAAAEIRELTQRRESACLCDLPVSSAAAALAGACAVIPAVLPNGSRMVGW